MRKRRFFLIVSLVVIMVGTGYGIGSKSMESVKKQPKESGLFEEALTLITKQIVHPVKEHELIEGAMRGMVDSVQDPYSTYYTAEEAAAHKESLAGERVGIGAEITRSNGKFMIVSPIKGSPAEKAGLKPYDEVVKIDAQPTSNLSFQAFVQALRGKEGSTLTLTIYRPTQNEHIELSMKREVMEVQTVSSEMLSHKNQSIGYIAITTFGEETIHEWKKATDQLLKAKATGLVIDVRGNPGGYLASVSQMISSLMEEGIIFAYMEDAKGQLTALETEDVKDEKPFHKKLTTIPVVVLQDEGSASASEVLSSALQDHQRSFTVGTKSFGKGTVQESFALSNGDEMKLSTHKWLTPKKQWIHQLGIDPDLEVKPAPLFHIQMQMLTGTYRRGDIHEEIQYAQQVLKGLGFDLLRTDGYFDRSTEKAVQQFRKKHHMKASPQMERSFYLALQKEVETYRSSNEHDRQLQMALDYFATQ